MAAASRGEDTAGAALSRVWLLGKASDGVEGGGAEEERGGGGVVVVVAAVSAGGADADGAGGEVGDAIMVAVSSASSPPGFSPPLPFSGC